MAVKIRLQRHGRTKQPYYFIVVADARSPRDGKFIERIGSYNPMTQPALVEVNNEKAVKWLENGAQPTDTVRTLLQKEGVMYRRHLNRGVTKGKFSEEEADKLYNEFREKKSGQTQEERQKEIKRREEAEQARLAAEKEKSDARAEEIRKRKAEELKALTAESEEGAEEATAEAAGDEAPAEGEEDTSAEA